MLAYPITLTPDGDTVMATSKDFPELTTFGEDNDGALLHAIDALEEAIAARIATREDVPQPPQGKSPAALPTRASPNSAGYPVACVLLASAANESS